MRQILFIAALTLLGIWTIACIFLAAWYFEDVREMARVAAETWQAVQSARMGAPAANSSNAESVANVLVGSWVLIAALTWNLIATPLAIIALIAKD